MRRSTLHRLTQKCVALVAIAVMGGVQPMLSACTCGLAIPQSVFEAAVETEQCCSSCCKTSAVESSNPASSDCCSSSGGGPSNCDDCGCCVEAEKAPLLPSSTTVQDDGQSSPLAHPAILPNALHSGLNGVAWHNAFDLSSPGGTPGVRLHALLSVWRN
jgi:hypothetical protein